MKRTMGILLVLVMLCVCVPVFAEEWICASCGNTVSGNFCNNCGAGRPSEDWTCANCGNDATGKFCSNCGMAREDGNQVTAYDNREIESDASTKSIEDPDEFKAVANIVLKPVTDASVREVIDMGDSLVTVEMTNGDTYMGLISAGDGAYGIELMNYSAADYSSIDSPYDFKSADFKRVLNYLLRNDGVTVKSVVQLFGDLYTVTDSAGNSYMLSVLCSPSMVMVGLLGS